MKYKEVIIVEEKKMISEALGHALNNLGYQVRIYNDGYTFRNAIAPDALSNSMVLLDLHLKGFSSFQIISDLVSLKIPLLVMSFHSDMLYAPKVLEMGANAYISKEESLDSLKNAIDIVLAGKRFLSASVKDQLAFGSIYSSLDLSSREKEVLSCLLKRHSLKEIASLLNLSIKTVASFKARLMKKIGAQSDLDIYKFGHINGLLTS